MEALIPIGLVSDLNDFINYYGPCINKVICVSGEYIEIILVGDISITIGLGNSKFAVDGLGKYVEADCQYDVKECVDILIKMNDLWEKQIKQNKEGT